MILKTKDKIIIKDELFSPLDILSCGQVFRFKGVNDKWTVYSKDKKAELISLENSWIIEGDVEYFYNYFDLDKDYNLIITSLRNLPLTDNAIEYGKNIRILKQDVFETIISFIISQNNLIPRIKGIIERICTASGQNMGDFYSFPTPQKMASLPVEFYTKIGAGYRDVYLFETVNAIYKGTFDINKPFELSTDEAKKYLMTLKGVGPKVADCILLFAYQKYDVFPVDTWIKKLYFMIYPDSNPKTSPNKMRQDLCKLYGDYCGIAQQYLFYYLRK